jgi:hypothetical protein
MADDKIIIEYEAKIAGLEGSLNKIEKELKDVEKTAGNSFKKVTAEGNKAGAAVDKTTQKVSVLGDKFKDLANNLPFVGQIKQVTELASAVTGLEGAAIKGANGFKILKYAIAATGIGALVIAIVGLIAYFKRTDEGATRLAGVMAGLGAAVDIVTGLFVGVGDAIFEAATSLEGFKTLLGNVVQFLSDQVTVRIFAVIDILKELGALLADPFNESKSQKAFENINTSLLDLTTGVKDTQSKIKAFADEVTTAADAAYYWEKRMDALNDKIRENSITIAENDASITRLLIAAKNKQISDEQSLKLLGQASALEKQNLAITLANEEAKLALIKERNNRESDSINQDIKAGEKRRSINDNLAQEEVDQINKITRLKAESAVLQEKINNRTDAKNEEIFQNSLKRLENEETAKETVAKESFLRSEISAKELEDTLYNIKLNGLKNQKTLLEQSGRDVTEINKAIVDLELGAQLKRQKDAADSEKAITDAVAKESKARADKLAKYQAEADADTVAKKKRLQEVLNEILQGAIPIAQDVANGLADIAISKKQMQFDEELRLSQEKTNQETKNLETQLRNGEITQAQFDAKKLALDKKQKKAESEIKRKQFLAEKKAALIGVAIDTAAAVAKTLATLGVPAGLLASGIAIATGAAQAAIISAQPVPKFKDGVIGLKGKGTDTSDSIPAMLSRNESVMTAQETKQHGDVLKAIRTNSLDDFIKDTYVFPALRDIEVKNNRERAARRTANEKKLDSIISNINLDTSNLERITKGNKSVGINNTKQFAKEMAREMQINSNWYK